MGVPRGSERPRFSFPRVRMGTFPGRRPSPSCASFTVFTAAGNSQPTHPRWGDCRARKPAAQGHRKVLPPSPACPRHTRPWGTMISRAHPAPQPTSPPGLLGPNHLPLRCPAQGSATCCFKGRESNTVCLGFEGVRSVTTTRFCHWNVTAAVGDAFTNEQGRVPIKLYL